MTRLRTFIVWCSMLVMTSCASRTPVVVKVPVPVDCPKPPVLEGVADPVLALTDTTPVEDAVKAVRASRVLWREKAKELARILVGYGANNPFE